MRQLSILKQSQHSLQTVPQKTMDPKFNVILFCVEAGASAFNSIHALTHLAFISMIVVCYLLLFYANGKIRKFKMIFE